MIESFFVFLLTLPSFQGPHNKAKSELMTQNPNVLKHLYVVKQPPEPSSEKPNLKFGISTLKTGGMVSIHLQPIFRNPTPLLFDLVPYRFRIKHPGTYPFSFLEPNGKYPHQIEVSDDSSAQEEAAYLLKQVQGGYRLMVQFRVAESDDLTIRIIKENKETYGKKFPAFLQLFEGKERVGPEFDTKEEWTGDWHVGRLEPGDYRIKFINPESQEVIGDGEADLQVDGSPVTGRSTRKGLITPGLKGEQGFL